MTGTSDTAEARAIRSAAVYTHRRPEVTGEIVHKLIAAAEQAGVELRFDPEETAKHALEGNGRMLRTNAENLDYPDLAIVLGGDGTTLRFLRAYAGTDVPVFSINCGRVGFLATVDREQVDDELARAFGGDFEVIKLSALRCGTPGDHEFAVNEVSFQRGSNMNVALISYSLGGEVVMRAPCDGLIAATPAGSTAYNLSAGGPILAWELKGFVVSMVAPHALSARALVAAPEDVLRVVNEGREPIDVVIDGMRTGELGPGEPREVRFRADAVGLAQLPGSTFYSRYREKLRLLTG